MPTPIIIPDTPQERAWERYQQAVERYLINPSPQNLAQRGIARAEFLRAMGK